MKIVVNKCFGGFSLSQAACTALGLKWDGSDIERTDLKLIRVVERLGSKAASGEPAELRVIEIPDGIEYEIDNCDGLETVHEKHRSW